MKNSLNLKALPLLAAFCLAAGAAVSCNEKNDSEEEIAVTYSTVAVKGFSLSPDTKVLSHLDSVFFSIDIDHGVIYNADSLPKGTNVSRVIPVITFANSMSEVSLSFHKDNRTDTTVNYLTHPSDSIDFTRPVAMHVVAQDGRTSYDYTLKVNVHESLPDSMIWTSASSSSFPSVSNNPRNQKAVEKEGTVYSLILESDNSLYLSVIPELSNPSEFTLEKLEMPFVPDIKTFTFAGNEFYILSDNGELYATADLKNWENTGETWINILGGYLGSAIGLKEDTTGAVWHCHYPENELITDSEASPEFPVYGQTSPGFIETGWSPQPIAIFFGGRLADGSLTDATWGFDGENWTIISEINPPALEEATLIRYYAFRSDPNNLSVEDFDAWMIFGGRDSESKINESLYLSLDNGLTWILASYFMQLPEEIPALFGADGFVQNSRLSTDLSDIWTTRGLSDLDPDISFNGYDISWNCPYIYIVGGFSSDNTLSKDIWRACLQRLTFTPNF